MNVYKIYLKENSYGLKHIALIKNDLMDAVQEFECIISDNLNIKMDYETMYSAYPDYRDKLDEHIKDND